MLTVEKDFGDAIGVIEQEEESSFPDSRNVASTPGGVFKAGWTPASSHIRPSN